MTTTELEKPESASQTSGRIRDTLFRVTFLDIGVSDRIVILAYKFPLCRIPICRSSFIRSRAPYIEPPLKSCVAQCIFRQCFKGLRAVVGQYVEFIGDIRVAGEQRSDVEVVIKPRRHFVAHLVSVADEVRLIGVEHSVKLAGDRRFKSGVVSVLVETAGVVFGCAFIP